MKSKVRIVFALAILVVAFSLHQNSEKESDVLLQNIEAIANPELNARCYGVGSIDCPLNHTKVMRIY